VAIHNPDLERPPKVLTQTLARWLGKAATTVRAWVGRGILPQPEKRGTKTVLHDVAAVLRALGRRVPWGEGGYVERKARTAARREARNGLAAPLPADGGEEATADDLADDLADDEEREGAGA
jgi:hypothetical protein